MFFDGDIDMVARAGASLPNITTRARAAERGAEYPVDADESRIFWKRIELATEAVLKEKPGDGGVQELDPRGTAAAEIAAVWKWIKGRK